MGLLLHYFTAATPELAAGTLADGPDREAALNGRGMLDPSMGLGALDAALTGRTFREVMRDPSADVFVDGDARTSGFTDPSGGHEAVVIAINLPFQEALVAADETQLRAAAATAAESPDLFSPVDAAEVGDFAVALARLVGDGKAKGERLYAWWCP